MAVGTRRAAMWSAEAAILLLLPPAILVTAGCGEGLTPSPGNGLNVAPPGSAAGQAGAPGSQSPRRSSTGASSPATTSPGAADPAGPPVPGAADKPVIRVPDKFGFLRGNTHVHTNGSGDSDTPPADAARWYEERGYDFIVLTDHNNVTVLKGGKGPAGRLHVYPGVELTFNVAVQDAAEGSFGGHCLHMNAWFLPDTAAGFLNPEVPEMRTRLAFYRSSLAAAAKHKALVCINHPNYTSAADSAMLTRLNADGMGYFELWNSHPKSLNDGGPGLESTEKMWDTVLTAGGKLWGVASDDTHHYYDAAEIRRFGGDPRVGDLAWIMVRAKANTAADIRAAMEAGDFYGSTGVTLRTLDADRKRVALEVAAAERRTYTIRFIGAGGKVLAEVKGPKAEHVMKGDEVYVRATVKDDAGAAAWTQPVFLDKRGK